MATIDDIRLAFENILQRSGSEVTDAEINSYVSAVDSGALTLAQARAALINSPEGQDVQDVVRLYQTVFGRVPDQAGLNFQVDTLRGPATEADLANSFAASPEFTARFGGNTVNTAFINAVYQQVLGRAPAASEVQFYLDSGFSAGRIALAFSESPEFRAAIDGAVAGFLDDAGRGAATYTGSLDANLSPGSTIPLTAGVDTLVGTAGNDLFDATQTSAPAATLTALDSIDGGAGTDTLRVVQTAAINTTAIAGLSIKNVENISLTSGGAITTDATGFTGATTLTVTSAGNVAATAAATTDINVTAAGLTTGVVVNGGKDVFVQASDTATTAAASGNAITVGGTTAAAGAVEVNYSETVTDAANAGIAGGTVTVQGGTTVEVNSTASVGAGNNAADVFTIGAVKVTGNAATTSVTVNQTAATAAFNGTTQKNISIANGAVTIEDGNAATAADTLKTVTLANFGATTITSTALDTLNLTGSKVAGLASGAVTLDKSAADTTVAPTALNLNIAGGSIGAITGTQAAAFTTVNLASAANATIANASFAANKTLNVSGEGVTTFTAFTAANNAALTAINSTGGGLTIGTQLATNVAVTGGAGAETISVGATTKAINLGAGNDVVTVSTTTLGAGGSINGSEGTDTIVANTNGSAFVGLPGFSGFEVLRVAGSAAEGSHNAVGFTALEVGAIAGDVTFTNVAAGVGLTQLATLGNDVAVTLADATGTNDSFNLSLKSAGAIGSSGDTITINGVENINISTIDTDTTAHVNTVALVADAVKAISVSGNTGLTVVSAPATLTSFDASGLVLSKVTDTGVTFTSTNATVGGVVTIIGSNGVDTLSGSATANDTINGGAGADTLIYVGGSDTFTGGAGADIFGVNAIGTKTSFLTVTDATTTDAIDFAGISQGTIADATLGSRVTLGAAATLDQYLDAAAAGNGGTNALVTWFQFSGDTYVVVDNGAGATFTSGTDAVVKLTGVLDLSTSALASEVLTIA